MRYGWINEEWEKDWDKWGSILIFNKARIGQMEKLVVMSEKEYLDMVKAIQGE